MSSNKTFGEKIEEIVPTCDFEAEEFGSRICKWCGERKGSQIHTAKQAILDLIESDVIVAASFSDDILAEQRSILRGEKG